MNFDHTEKVQDLIGQIRDFMGAHIYPNESVYVEQLSEPGRRWHTPTIVNELRDKARSQGLWNLFLPDSDFGAGLTNLEYAPLAEEMGRSVFFAPHVFNCNAPDTGNMEVLARYGTHYQQDRWLKPLLNAEIRSAFAMTEPKVASSDARNIECSIKPDGDEYVINGHKWWISNAMNEDCKVFILMGKTDPDAASYQQQSMIIVERDTPGVTI
ncbi:MAG: acyl-CoA dehydrogenase family protein, partial [Pseudomonadota bacterium]